MDVNQVLRSTLSPDHATRSNAEQQLSQAAEADFAGYLRTLSQELANDQAQQDIRMAAGLALKNSLSSREYVTLKELQQRWLQVPEDVRIVVKGLALKTLSSKDVRAGMQAAQFVASIAAIELPRQMWPELMDSLVQKVLEGEDYEKQTAVSTIGFICEMRDNDLVSALAAHSNAILTAVVSGARKEEKNDDVRNASLNALGDSLAFVGKNFDNEGERNYIMQVICEATQASDPRVQQGAYGCLNRVMSAYYEKMGFYMEKALFGLTIQGMKSEDEDVAKLAIEFWCTVCEIETELQAENSRYQDRQPKAFYNFAYIATQEIIPVLLELLTKQDEDATEDEYNVQRASNQCLQLYALCVGNPVVAPVINFIESNIRNEDWHYRDAAVSAFGAIVEGPALSVIDNMIKQAIPVLIGMMDDPVIHVRDSVAFTLGRICENCPASLTPDVHLPPLVSALFNGLSGNPRIASSCCFALMNLAESFGGERDQRTNGMTRFFADGVDHLLQTTSRNDLDNSVRTAAYEVLNAFVTNAGIASLEKVAALADVILQRLEGTIPMRQQVVSVEDRLTLDEMQTSLANVMMSIIQRLDREIKPRADRTMTILIGVLQSLNNKSSVAESIFGSIAALADAVEQDFERYMESIAPYLFNALNSQDEPQLCSMAVGLVSDITRALGANVQKYCDDFMRALLSTLGKPALSYQLKPAILQCFGDIAQVIGGAFESYLSHVGTALTQAGEVTIDQSVSFEVFDYICSLREAIMDAWDGAVVAMTGAGRQEALKPYMEPIFKLIDSVFKMDFEYEGLVKSTMGLIGDLADAFPNGEYARYLNSKVILDALQAVRKSNYSSNAKETAKWAREQVKRQPGGAEEGDVSFQMA